MTSVTDADREAAIPIIGLGARLCNARNPVLQIMANHREAGMIEGARLMKEAAVERLREHCDTIYWVDVSTLDPAAIVKGMSDE